MSITIQLGRPQNNRVAFLMCLLASAALLFTLFSLYTPLNADAIGLLILNLVALVIEVYIIHVTHSLCDSLLCVGVGSVSNAYAIKCRTNRASCGRILA